MVLNGRVLAVIFAVFQQEGRDVQMMLQNPNEFHSAIASMSDDANLKRQLFDYSFL
jgi:hypothetical protein